MLEQLSTAATKQRVSKHTVKLEALTCAVVICEVERLAITIYVVVTASCIRSGKVSTNPNDASNH